MYLIAIHVPIYVSGNTHLLATDWKRSLELLRDSLQDRYGDIFVVAPSLPASQQTDQALEVVDPREGVVTIPSFPLNTRARQYWLHYRSRWLRDVNRLAPSAAVVHAGFDDCYRPISWAGFCSGVRHNKPTVFVQDTDHVGKIEASLGTSPLPRRVERYLYKSIYERRCREGVEQAALSLLKGQDLIKRYGSYAKNPHNFHDSNYFSHEIIAAEEIAVRTQSCARGRRPLRLVYCGRLEARKGVDHSIAAVDKARHMGVELSLDIIGDGAERGKLKAQVTALGLQHMVRFHGQRQYGATLLRDLSGFDALLFTPRSEDTPRMIFDGYAAGLPLIGYAIPYVQERALEDRTAIVSKADDVEAMARTLCRVNQNRLELCELTDSVHAAAQYHAADAWYRRRAELTFEAVERHQSRHA